MPVVIRGRTGSKAGASRPLSSPPSERLAAARSSGQRRMGQKLGNLSQRPQRPARSPPPPPPLSPGQTPQRRASLFPLLRPKGDARLPPNLHPRRHYPVL